jgi:COP9 signalosome complex subunit 5
MDASLGLKYWELDNNVELVDPKRDALFAYDAAEHNKKLAGKPWKADKHYFRRVRISAVALVKMVMHARSGGELEVMGMMQGHIDGDTFVVTDAFRLPVEGTETRVNAHAEADEYMVNYTEMGRTQGARAENIVGWYHSHPGYGCWLSGIDVGTQMQQQKFQDPFLAVVIDPDRTINAGKVEIGAFRTLEQEDAGPPTATEGVSEADGGGTKKSQKKPPASADPLDDNGGGPSSGVPVYGSTVADAASVPLNKAEEFGAHASKYYSLEVSHFKSTLDTVLLEQLWSKYWVQTLSQSPLLSSRDFSTRQLQNLVGCAEGMALAMSRGRGAPGGTENPMSRKLLEVNVDGMAEAAAATALRERTGLAALEIKEIVFGEEAGGVGR